MQGPQRNDMFGHQLVKVPAKPGLDPCAFSYKVLSVIDQQLEMALASIEASVRQARLAQRGSGDRHGVDGIGLAWLTSGTAGAGHQLGRHPKDVFPAPQQVAFESARDLPAVFERPTPLGPLTGPVHRRQMTVARGCDGCLRDLSAQVVDGDEGCGCACGSRLR